MMATFIIKEERVAGVRVCFWVVEGEEVKLLWGNYLAIDG
jgi:hypothetical protein